MKLLGYVVSQFPELHETFILREFVALREAGVPLRIYSLKRCRDRIVHSEAQPLLQQTTYLALDHLQTWTASILEMLRCPHRAFSTFAWTVRYHAWPVTSLSKAMGVWLQALALARWARRDGIVHLHAHWATMPTTAAVIASKRLGIPFSFTAHAWDIFVRNRSLPEKVRLAQQVVTCTEYNRRYLTRWCPEARHKVLLNYHGVNLAQFRASRASGAQVPGTDAPEVPLFLSVGRLVETKGFADVLDAYGMLKARGVRFRAVIVGQGPLQRSLERGLRERGLSGVVEMRPVMHQDALRQLYASAFAFVLPSVVASNGDRDGIPNVILEAMAMGLPVISTAVSGIPEAVQDQRTGFLVSPNDPTQLARACETLLEQRSVARALGDHGRMWAETQFNEREHMQRLVRQMQALLGGGEGGRSGRIRVLFLVWSLAVGGAERVVTLLARHLDPARYEPLVVCLNRPGAFADELRANGIRVIALYKRGPLDLHAVWRLFTLIRRERIDLVHTHLWGANLWGRLTAWIAGVPAVTTEHNVDTWKRSWHFVIDRWLTKRTQRVVAVSRAVQDFYVAQGLPSNRIQTIPNGIEVARFAAAARSPLYQSLGWASDAPVFIAIGRLVPVKQHAVFIDAMATLMDRYPDVRGLIVGDGPLRAALEGRIAERGLTGRVVLAGVRDDVAALLHGARALVLTSDREGLPIVLLEAMASGIPVVATAVGGIPEVLDEGRTGWLVAPDAPDTLVDRLAAIAHDPLLAKRMGAAARETVQSRWSLEAMVRQHEALYQRILQPRRRVVYVIDDLDFGGAQRQALELVRHLPRDRFDCSVISLSTGRLALLDAFRASGVPVTTIAQSGKWSWRCFWKLYRSLRALRPDLVHTWLFTADLYGRLAAWVAGVPVIMSAVRSVESWKPPHYVAADRCLRHVTDAFTVNAQAIGDVLRNRERVDPLKIFTVYNGVDLGVFDPAAADGAVRQRIASGRHEVPLIGVIGRLSPEKDHATFLRAAALVARERGDAQFLIAGNGPLRGEIEAMAAALDLTAQVHFLESRHEVTELFAALDLVVVSSRYEGCCNVILEGMAMGKPVIATEVGGNPELVVPGRTGWLVPAQDPAAMAHAILQVLNDRVQAEAFGRQGRLRVEAHFSTAQMVEQITTVYDGLLNAHRREHP